MNLKSAALAATLGLSASLAFGDDIVRDITLSPDGGLFTADFTATHLESSFFVDTFDFELPAAQTGTVTAEFFSSSPHLALLGGGFLNGESFEFLSVPGGQTASLTVGNLSGPQTLSVFGIAGDPFSDPVPLTASYTGSIRFTPESVGVIPEPQTYALMLAGLGLVGLAARRRRKG